MPDPQYIGATWVQAHTPRRAVPNPPDRRPPWNGGDIVTLQPDVHMRDNEETGGNGRSEELPYFPLFPRRPAVEWRWKHLTLQPGVIGRFLDSLIRCSGTLYNDARRAMRGQAYGASGPSCLLHARSPMS